MPLTYKNTVTGRTAEVLDPNEVQAAAEAEAERLYRGGTKKAQKAAEHAGESGRKMAIHAGHTIERMNASQKWQRVDGRAKSGSADAPRKRPAAKKTESEATKPEPDAAE